MTWDRLAGDGQFMLGLAYQLGEAQLAAGVARAADSDKAALVAFEEKIRTEGGVLPLVQRHLQDVPGTWSAERAKLGPDDSLGASRVPVLTVMDSTLCCVGGVLMVVGGVGVAVFGGKILPGAEIIGAAGAVVGVVLAASCC